MALFLEALFVSRKHDFHIIRVYGNAVSLEFSFIDILLKFCTKIAKKEGIYPLHTVSEQFLFSMILFSCCGSQLVLMSDFAIVE